MAAPASADRTETEDGDVAGSRSRTRGGRPTKAAAAARDERLLEIATRMFLEQGFDATSMDGLAEAAAIGKATLYARYADKTALFAAVLRQRILHVYGAIEEELKGAPAGEDLEGALRRLARRLVEKSLSPSSLALGRILSAQGPRFPDLARLAVEEGGGRQMRLVESVLVRHASAHRFAIPDLSIAADFFLSLALGRVTRLALLGVVVDRKSAEARADAAVRFFLSALLAEPTTS